MAGITSELIEKARKAENPEHLVVLARENGIEMTEEEAKMQFANLHPQQGELSDEELDNVAGGCNDSKDRMIVSSAHHCHYPEKFRHIYYHEQWVRSDNLGLRKLWRSACCTSPNDDKRCGNCYYLEFDGGTGYCGLTGK